MSTMPIRPMAWRRAGGAATACAGRLIVVFGAGGERDVGKRPLMGAAAGACADIAIVTDDNPRSEAPAAIRAAVLGGAPGLKEIADRRAAIRAAAAMLERWRRAGGRRQGP